MVATRQRGDKIILTMTNPKSDDPVGVPGLRGELKFELGAGFFNHVYVHADDRYVVKLAKRLGPLSQPLSLLVRFHAEHTLAASYFNVPATYHVRMEMGDGRQLNVTLQERLSGVLMKDIPDNVLYSGRYGCQVQRAMSQLELASRKLGWLPDVIGGQLIWGLHDIRNSANFILTDDGKLWLLDPSSFFLWFSRRNLVGWVYTSFLLRSARRLQRRASGVRCA